MRHHMFLIICVAAVSVVAVRPVVARDNAVALDPSHQVTASAAPSDEGPAKACNAGEHFEESEKFATLLDPDAEMQQRQQILVELEKKANAGSVYAQYYVGSLYRAGHILPQALVDRDLEKARRYLGHAAVGGKPDAMRKLAEIELVEKHPAEAMVWAQLFAHYQPILQGTLAETAGHGSTADLLARVFDAFGSRDIGAVQSDVAAFMQQYDAEILAVESSKAQMQACPEYRMISPGEIRQASEDDSRSSKFGKAKPGTAEFLLVFKADGSVAKALALDAVPDPGLLSMLRPIAEQSRVRPSSIPARYALLPVVFTYDQAKIRH